MNYFLLQILHSPIWVANVYIADSPTKIYTKLTRPKGSPRDSTKLYLNKPNNPQFMPPIHNNRYATM